MRNYRVQVLEFKLIVVTSDAKFFIFFQKLSSNTFYCNTRPSSTVFTIPNITSCATFSYFNLFSNFVSSGLLRIDA